VKRLSADDSAGSRVKVGHRQAIIEKALVSRQGPLLFRAGGSTYLYGNLVSWCLLILKLPFAILVAAIGRDLRKLPSIKYLEISIERDVTVKVAGNEFAGSLPGMSNAGC
jgi:hypothetical protein